MKNRFIQNNADNMAKIEILGVDPAPIATPTEEIIGVLLAEYLKPRRIITNKSPITK